MCSILVNVIGGYCVLRQETGGGALVWGNVHGPFIDLPGNKFSRSQTSYDSRSQLSPTSLVLKTARTPHGCTYGWRRGVFLAGGRQQGSLGQHFLQRLETLYTLNGCPGLVLLSSIADAWVGGSRMSEEDLRSPGVPGC